MLSIALGIRNISSQLPDLVYALLSGLNAATVGLIALAGVQLSERQITNQMTRLVICITACVGLLYRGNHLKELILTQRYGIFPC
jgi:chromate transport protein ChrA